MMRRPNHKTRGFLMLDAVLGLALIALVITFLTVAVSQHRRGAIHFATQRELVHEAEHVLSELQQGQPARPLHEASEVTVTPLQMAESGLAWVEVRVERETQAATLIGWAGRPRATEGAEP